MPGKSIRAAPTGRALVVVGAALLAGAGALLVFVAAGGAGLALAFCRVAGEAAERFPGRIVAGLLGGAVVLVDAALVLRALGLGRIRAIDFEDASGRTSIEVSALALALRRAVIEDDDVVDAEVAIRVPRSGRSRPVVCSVQVELRERSDVPQRGRELSATIRRRFLRIIPTDVDPVVNVTVRIAPPAPDSEAMKETQAIAVQETPSGPVLPDVHDFTGERRYGERADQDK